MSAYYSSKTSVNGLRTATSADPILNNNKMITNSKIQNSFFGIASLIMLLCLTGQCCLFGEIGTDHIRIELNPNFGIFGHTFIIDQEFEENGLDGRRDYTGADFVLGGAGPNSFKFAGTWLDDGVSVFELQAGDVFSEEGIKAGIFRELGHNIFNPDSSEGVVNFSEPVYLGFRTPITSLHPDFGGSLRGIGWAKVEMGPIAFDQPILRLLDHAMEYGGDSIVVGESNTHPQNQGIPTANFGDRETLVPLETDNAAWASGDFDGDGSLDLLIEHADGGFQVFQQRDDQTFEKLSGDRITQQGNPDAIGDVDGDGDLDVWVSLGGFFAGDSTSSLWLNQGDGSFSEFDQILPASQAAHLNDLDNDGDLDVVATVFIDDFNSELQTWLNDGSGHFQKSATLRLNCGPFGLPSNLGDLNGDGFVDLFYVCGGPAKVAFNQGDGSFVDSGHQYDNTNILTMFPGSNLALNDMDGDGDLDAVIPNENFANALWLNNGKGEFALAQSHLGTWSEFVSVGDMDTDGDLDILFHSSESVRSINDPHELLIYRNEGTDLFTKVKTISIENKYGQPKLLDIDHDDDLDILIKIGKELVVFKNTIEYVEPTPPEGSIEIPDEGLRRGIYAALEKTLADGVSEEDMLNLKVLNLSRATRGSTAPMIQDFSALEMAVNLTELDLSGGGLFATQPSFNVVNFNFLKPLESLKILRLPNNNLTRIELPADLAQLEVLDISANNINQVDLPTGYQNLKELNIEFNALSQLSLPDDLINLENLHAAGNQLTEFQFPASLTKLKQVDFGVNQLRTLELPPEASQLEMLKLRYNQFTQISFPIDSSRLIKLDLGNSAKRMGGYSFLDQFSGLKELQVTDRAFDLSSLNTPLTELEILSIDLETGKEFELPSGFASLKNIVIEARHLNKILLPDDLHNLEDLSIYSERLKHIELPEGLNTVQRISLFGGRIETVLLEGDMTHLENIDLTGNRIKTLIIPKGVGKDADSPSAWLRDNPLRFVQVPAKWRSRTHFNQALISTDRLGVDTSGNLRLPVVAEFGTVLIQKSTDLKNWTTIDEMQFRGGDGTKLFRARNVLSEASGFYRVRLKD